LPGPAEFAANAQGNILFRWNVNTFSDGTFTLFDHTTGGSHSGFSASVTEEPANTGEPARYRLQFTFTFTSGLGTQAKTFTMTFDGTRRK
jgi:hypothetical protein